MQIIKSAAEITLGYIGRFGMTLADAREVGMMVKCPRCKTVQRVSGYMHAGNLHGPTVTCCGRTLEANRIKATKNNTPCDHRCTAAKGFSCNCSCGGKNHGVQS